MKNGMGGSIIGISQRDFKNSYYIDISTLSHITSSMYLCDWIIGRTDYHAYRCYLY